MFQFLLSPQHASAKPSNHQEVERVQNLMAHGDAREGK